jgi:hypothetical protein
MTRRQTDDGCKSVSQSAWGMIAVYSVRTSRRNPPNADATRLNPVFSISIERPMVKANQEMVAVRRIAAEVKLLQGQPECSLAPLSRKFSSL